MIQPAFDPLGKIILLVVSTLFLFCSFYAVAYLRVRQERDRTTVRTPREPAPTRR